MSDIYVTNKYFFAGYALAYILWGTIEKDWCLKIPIDSKIYFSFTVTNIILRNY